MQLKTIQKFFVLPLIFLILFSLSACSQTTADATKELPQATESSEVTSSLVEASASAVAKPGELTRGQAFDIIYASAKNYRGTLTPEEITQGLPEGGNDSAVTRIEALVMLSNAFGTLPKPGDAWLMATTIYEDTGDEKGMSRKADLKYSDIPDWAADAFENLYNGRVVPMTREDGDGDWLLNSGEVIDGAELTMLLRRVYALYGTRLEDDFYASVNKEWLDMKHDYEDGTFDHIIDVTNDQLKEITAEVIAGPWKQGSLDQKAADYYETIVNAAARDKAGLTPIKGCLDAVDAAKTLQDFEDALVKIGNDLSYHPLLDFFLTVNPENSLYPALSVYIHDGDISDEEADSEAVTQYRENVEKYFTLAGGKYMQEIQQSAKEAVDIALALVKETGYSSGKEDHSGYKRYTLDELQEILPEMNVKKIFLSSGFYEDDIYLEGEAALQNLAAVYNAQNLDALKSYIRSRLLMHHRVMLDSDMANVEKVFESRTLEDIADVKVPADFKAYFDYLYTKRYFSDEIKDDVTKLTAGIIEYYRGSIAQQDFMSDATKQTALKKLDNMVGWIGGPVEPGELIERVNIKDSAHGGTFVGNAAEIARVAREMETREQGKPIDRTLYPNDAVLAHSVGASCLPDLNGYCIPVGILQAPFYEYGAPIEKNLAGIGYVIGHEITHAFDVLGSTYDENGNKTNWWTPEDRAAFDKLCDAVVSYYDGCEAAPGIPVDGKLTLGENTADLGGMAAALSVLKSSKENPDYKLFFESAAQLWREAKTYETYSFMMVEDIHSPHNLRVNRVLSTFQEFYDAYGIKEGDGMYVPVADRVRIW